MWRFPHAAVPLAISLFGSLIHYTGSRVVVHLVTSFHSYVYESVYFRPGSCVVVHLVTHLPSYQPVNFEYTVIMRVIAHIGVIEHIGVIAPLCDKNPS